MKLDSQSGGHCAIGSVMARMLDQCGTTMLTWPPGLSTRYASFIKA
jgi:hypothetical protein